MITGTPQAPSCALGSIDSCSTIDLVLFRFTKSPLFEVQETSVVGIRTTSSTYFYGVIQKLFTGERGTQAAPQWQHTNEVKAKVEQGTTELLTVNSSAWIWNSLTIEVYRCERNTEGAIRHDSPFSDFKLFIISVSSS